MTDDVEAGDATQPLSVTDDAAASLSAADFTPAAAAAAEADAANDSTD